MKIKIFAICSLLLAICSGANAAGDFQSAAQLLSAARAGNVQTVQQMVNAGADINFVDNTGLSIVCTAIMNNDIRAAQILQTYGADASRCDQQIKRYNQRLPKEESGGLFSGLSTTQNMALAAGGAALVVGGVLWLSGAFSGGNGNSSSSDGGDRPNNGNNGDGGTNSGIVAWSYGKLPVGPSNNCNATLGICSYDVDDWSPDDATDIRRMDFNYMKDFNYLMMMHAYDAFSRGYEGMGTIRMNSANQYKPFNLTTLPYPANALPAGGRPTAVAMITTNGVNDAGSAMDGLISYLKDGQQVTIIQSACASNINSPECQAALAAGLGAARKYYNRSNTSDILDLTEKEGFDYSGHDTVFGDASVPESLLAKIIAGWYGNDGRQVGDAYGFMPLGQLSVYRTGGGKQFDSFIGDITDVNTNNKWDTGDTIVIGGITYTLTVNEDGTFTASDGGSNSFAGTKVGNTLLLDNNDEYEILNSGTINKVKVADLFNYRAMLHAAQEKENGRFVNSVIANLALAPGSDSSGYATVGGAKIYLDSLTAQNDVNRRTAFKDMIDSYYNLDPSNNETENSPGLDADALFRYVLNNQAQILINSAGYYKYGLGDDKSLTALEATFENYAPMVYKDLEHLFMTVVAVQNGNGITGGTSGADDISDYNDSSKVGLLQLSKWADADGNTYASRKCGMSAGRGEGGVDPWCFAAAGYDSASAVASMAGAVGAVKSAFDYIENKQLFALLALTADGYMLGTNPDTGKAWAGTADLSKAALIGYLKSKYKLPGEYDQDLDGDSYLNAFADVFGYGLVNIERATRPGTQVNYYNSNGELITGGYNAYWRNPSISFGGAIGSRNGSIKTAYYDVLSSVDGSMTLPRVFEDEFALGTSGRQGLYLGDVLGEFKTTNKKQKLGNKEFDIEISFSESNRQYHNMSGLNELSFGFASGDWNFGAKYENHFGGDGIVSRFDATDNQILSMARNTVSSGAAYNMGKWSFGGRAFSGSITDETLMETDPTISNRYEPLKLGTAVGAESQVRYAMDKLSFGVNVGTMRENKTVLGTYSDGLLDLGGGDTVYVDSVIEFAPADSLRFIARATFARTNASPTGEIISGMSALDSNAFSVGAELGGWSFAVAQPLAITNGQLRYVSADFDVVEKEQGGYDLVANPYNAFIDLSPSARETRFSLAYRTQLGENTDGAFGFIYRLNPNHTNSYGNEGIVMMKLRHAFGL